MIIDENVRHRGVVFSLAAVRVLVMFIFVSQSLRRDLTIFGFSAIVFCCAILFVKERMLRLSLCYICGEATIFFGTPFVISVLVGAYAGGAFLKVLTYGVSSMFEDSRQYCLSLVPMLIMIVYQILFLWTAKESPR